MKFMKIETFTSVILDFTFRNGYAKLNPTWIFTFQKELKQVVTFAHHAIKLTARTNALKEKHKLCEERLEIDTDLQISPEKSNLLNNLSDDDNKSVRSTTVKPTDERTPAVEPV
ncbi:hypothetical protein SNE40_018120 [Patella caerulea]|uniref:Uncharacterized protein n=1 Tax=Patella caerulea TaxID=87958 RepID=A0AAN8JB85_PATCE